MCAIWLPRVLVRKHKPYSKQRRSRLWSKPVNVRTWELQWRLVLDPIVMYMPSVRADTPERVISAYKHAY